MRRILSRERASGRALLALALLCVAVGVTLLLPPITNLMLVSAIVMAISIMGLSVLTGWSGQISLGHGGFMAVGAFSAAIASRDFDHLPIVIVLLIATVSGALTGLIVGLPATRLRGPYLAGMTLAFAFAVPPLIQAGGEVTGGSGGLALNRPEAPTWFMSLLGTDDPTSAGAHWLAVLCLVVLALVMWLMSSVFSSRFGRSMRLVRENDVAAELVGLSLPKIRVQAFVISSAIAGLAGGMFALTKGGIAAQDFTPVVSFTLLALMVLGGMGTLLGAILGGLLSAYSDDMITWLTSRLGIDPWSSFGANLKTMLFAALLIITMLTAPKGLAGLVSAARSRLMRRRP